MNNLEMYCDNCLMYKVFDYIFVLKILIFIYLIIFICLPGQGILSA